MSVDCSNYFMIRYKQLIQEKNARNQGFVPAPGLETDTTRHRVSPYKYDEEYYHTQSITTLDTSFPEWAEEEVWIL